MSRSSWFGLIFLVCFLGLGSGSHLRAQPDEDQLDEWFVDAERALDRGRDRKALTLLKRLIEVESDDPEALAMGVQAAMNLGEWDQALAWTSPLLADDDRGRQARLDRARILMARGRLDAAKGVLEPLLEARSGKSPQWDFRAHALAAELEASRGRDADAQALFRRLVDEAKRVVIREIDDLIALGDAYVFFGGPREAERVYVEAQKKAGDDDPRPSVHLGEVYLSGLYLPGDAWTEFERALEIRPNLVPAIDGAWRAAIEWQKGERIERARRQLRAVRPDHLPLLLSQVQGALSNIRYEAAEKTLEKALAINPLDRSALAAQAALAFMRDGEEAGEEAIRRMLGVDPTYGQGLVEIAEVLNRRRRWPDALDLARRATEVDPASPLVWDRRARYAFFLGLDQEGHAALKKADQNDQFSHVWRKNMFEVRRVLKAYYEQEDTGRFLHRFHRRERGGFGPLAVPFAEMSYDILVKKYGYVPDGLAEEDHEGKILVEWFRDTSGFAARTLGFPNFGALGVCFGPFIGMNSPGSRQPGEFSWARTFHHELAHTITVGLSKGRTTRWMTEGLSTYEEIAFDPAWDRGLYRDLFDALEGGTLFPITDFDGGFGTPRVIFAYFQAGLVCKHLIDTYGLEKVILVLKGYAEDRTTAELWPEIFGLSATAYDEQFAAHVREMLKGTKLQPRLPRQRIQELEVEASKAGASADVHVRLAVAYVQARQWLDAQEAISRARAAGSDDPRLHWVRGMAEAGSGRTSRAQEHFQRAMAAGFEDFDMRILLAQAAEAADDKPLAVQHYEAARDAFPMVAKAADPRAALARLAREAGDVERAVALAEEHLQRAFENLPVRKELIDHYRSTGEVARELEHLRDWIMLDPLNAEMQKRLAEIGEEQGDAALAERSFQICLGLLLAGPESEREAGAELGLRLGRARALVALGPERAGDARAELERIAALDPENAEARELKSRLDSERGGRDP